MTQKLTNDVLTKLFPEKIYSQEKEDFFFEALICEGEKFVADLMKVYFEKNEEKSPYTANDFEVQHAIDDELVFLRIQVLNTEYTDIRRIYILFTIEECKAIRRTYYVAVEDDNNEMSCRYIRNDGSIRKCDAKIFDEDDETNTIAHDFLKVWNLE